MKVNDKIFEMSYYEIPLHVLRNGNVSEISSMDIVPGDLVFFNKTIRLPFEGVLLEG
jgi:magnesium-transporting ATPase (P-type)